LGTGEFPAAGTEATDVADAEPLFDEQPVSSVNAAVRATSGIQRTG
jgi:hypothetical protein